MEDWPQLPDCCNERRRWTLLTAFLTCIATACGFGNAWSEAAVRVESTSSTKMLGLGTDKLSYVRTTRKDRSVLEVVSEGRPRQHNWNIARLDLGRVWYVNLVDSTYREVVYATDRAVNRSDDERMIAEKARNPVSATIDTIQGVEVIAGLPTRHFRARITFQVGDSSASQQLTTIQDWWSTTDFPGRAILERYQAQFDSIGYRRGGKAFPDNEVQIPGSEEPVGWALMRPFALMMRCSAAIEGPSPARSGERSSSVARDSLPRIQMGGGEIRKIEVVDMPDRFFELPKGLKRESSPFDDPAFVKKLIQMNSKSSKPR